MKTPNLLRDLDEVDVLSTPPVNDDVLTYDNGFWVPRAPSGGGGANVHNERIMGEVNIDGTNWKSWGFDGWHSDVRWEQSLGADTGDPTWDVGMQGIWFPTAATLLSFRFMIYQTAAGGQTYECELWKRVVTDGGGFAGAHTKMGDISGMGGGNSQFHIANMTLTDTTIAANTHLRFYITGSATGTMNFSAQLRYQDA